MKKNKQKNAKGLQISGVAPTKGVQAYGGSSPTSSQDSSFLLSQQLSDEAQKQILEDNYNYCLAEIENLRHQKENIKIETKSKRSELHRRFVEKNKTFLLICDIAFILCVILNLGALGLTNILSQQAQYNKINQFVMDGSTGITLWTGNDTFDYSFENKTIKEINRDLTQTGELNPAQVKLNNFSSLPIPSKEQNKMFFSVIFFILYWSALTFCYILMRMSIKTEADKIMLISILVFYLFGMSFDFVNDLSIWIGTLLFG